MYRSQWNQLQVILIHGFAVWYDLLHSLGIVVTPYRQEEIKMWRVWRLFGGGRLWSLSLLCWQAKIWWTWQEEAMLCKEKVWVNNNFPFIMLTLTTFMWFCVGSLLSTTKSGKTTNVGISQNLSSQICTGLLLTNCIPLCLVLSLCFCSLHHCFYRPPLFRARKMCS